MRTISGTLLIAMLCCTVLSGSAQARTDGGYVPVVPDSSTHSAFIKDVYTREGKTYIVEDRIQWYEGEEADRVFALKEPDSGLDGTLDGYYIVNDCPELTATEADAGAEVLMQIYDRTGDSAAADIVWNEKLPLDSFIGIYEKDPVIREYPYHLTVKDGRIVKIVQQYVP